MICTCLWTYTSISFASTRLKFCDSMGLLSWLADLNISKFAWGFGKLWTKYFKRLYATLTFHSQKKCHVFLQLCHWRYETFCLLSKLCYILVSLCDSFHDVFMSCHWETQLVDNGSQMKLVFHAKPRILGTL